MLNSRITLKGLILLCLINALKTPSSARVTLKNTEYQGISVAIQNSVSSVQCENVVDHLKEVLSKTSSSLTKATGGLWIGKVKITLPATWKSCGRHIVRNAHEYSSPEEATIRVGAKHPIFGDIPWTLQPRGCGRPGEYISISENWLSSRNNTSEEKGRKLLQEWAKYRWGVFEEYGHAGDSIYPILLPESSKGVEPNYCADQLLEGTLKGRCGRNFVDCEFEIKNPSGPQSSLMSLPHLPRVAQFCNEKNHRENISTKHNLICDRKSAWSVIKAHKDFLSHKSWQSSVSRVGSGPELDLVRASFSRNLVIAYETSKFMSDMVNRFNYLKESISQFIMYEMRSSAKLGLISFASEARPITESPLRLEASTRRRLATSVMTQRPSQEPRVVEFSRVLRLSAGLLGDAEGIIVIIMKYGDEDLRVSASELAAEAGRNSVWIILYPSNSSKNDEIYREVARLTGGKVLAIRDEVVDGVDGVYLSPSVRLKLSGALRQLLHLDRVLDMRQIDLKVCQKSEVKCLRSLNLPQNKYSTDLLLYVYQESGDIIDYDSSRVDAEGGSCARERFVNMSDSIKTTEILKCSVNAYTSELTAQITRKRHHDIVILELVGRPRAGDAENPITFKVFSSENMHDLSYSDEEVPILYAQVFQNDMSLYLANVSAAIEAEASPSEGYRIALKDDGLGADITANDGVYSGYLLPVLQEGSLKMTIYATDNNGKARILPLSLSEDTEGYICCGNRIPLPADLPLADRFISASEPLSGTVIHSSSFIRISPGQIKDLKVTSYRHGKATVSFTATGSDMDRGKVQRYVLRMNKNSKILTKNPAPTGQMETIEMDLDCSERTVVSIAATDSDGITGRYSNQVVLFIPCNNLSIGAKFGIVIFVILLISLILFLCIIYRKKTREGGGLQFKCPICYSCCRKPRPKVERIRGGTSPGNPTVISVDEIKSVHDLILNLNRGAKDDRCNAEGSKLAEDGEHLYSELKDIPKNVTKSLLKNNTFYERENPDYQETLVTERNSQASTGSLDSVPKFIPSQSLNEVGVPLLNDSPSINFEPSPEEIMNKRPIAYLDKSYSPMIIENSESLHELIAPENFGGSLSYIRSTYCPMRSLTPKYICPNSQQLSHKLANNQEINKSSKAIQGISLGNKSQILAKDQKHSSYSPHESLNQSFEPVKQQTKQSPKISNIQKRLLSNLHKSHSSQDTSKSTSLIEDSNNKKQLKDKQNELRKSLDMSHKSTYNTQL